MPVVTARTRSVDTRSNVVATRAIEQLEVPIADLMTRYGWDEESWQGKLLKDAGLGGSISVEKLNNFLTHLTGPATVQHVTTDYSVALEDAIQAKRSVKATDFSGWESDLITAAAAHQNVESVSSEDWVKFMRVVEAGEVQGVDWLPMQRVAALEDAISAHTGEPSAWHITGLRDDLPGDPAIVREGSIRIIGNPVTRQSDISTNTIYGPDIRERYEKASRSNRFLAEPNVFHDSMKLVWYDKNTDPFPTDRGHFANAADMVTQSDKDRTFTLLNIGLQEGPTFNRTVWERLEAAVRLSAEATAGKLTVHTGDLWLDTSQITGAAKDDFSKIPAGGAMAERLDKVVGLKPEDMTWLTGNGGHGDPQHGGAVPTHYFKVWLAELPDGSKRAFAFVMANKTYDAPYEDDIVTALQAGRVSVDALQKMLQLSSGQDYQLFSDLAAAEREKLFADASTDLKDIPDIDQYHEAYWLLAGGAAPHREAWPPLHRTQPEAASRRRGAELKARGFGDGTSSAKLRTPAQPRSSNDGPKKKIASPPARTHRAAKAGLPSTQGS
jgi:DNA/RNA endonuclease G (NUC1)